MRKNKLPKIDKSADNATDQEVADFANAYSKGDPETVEAVRKCEAAAKAGDRTAQKVIFRMNQYAQQENNKFIKELNNNDPAAVETRDKLIEEMNSGNPSPAAKTFVMNYASPALETVGTILNEYFSNPKEAADFLEDLTPGKIAKILPNHVLTNEEAEALSYSKEEIAAIHSNDEPTVRKAREARQERAKKFLSGLLFYEVILLLEKCSQKKKDPATIQQNEVSKVDQYVFTNDRLTKALFGELEANGKPVSIVSNKPGTLTLWNNRKQQPVKVMVNVNFDEAFLKDTGIVLSGKKSLSKCAKEVYCAMLSHALAGNNILSLGMLGNLIYGTRDGGDLTPNQKKYILDGAKEVFATSMYINTAFSNEEAKDAIVSLKQEKGLSYVALEQIFPGHLLAEYSAYIKGNLVETAIELYSLPMLYNLQNKLNGSIIRIPIEVLAIPGRTDEDLVTIRGYLLRRVEPMKHQGNKLSRMIIFNNILSEVNIEPTDRASHNQIAATKKRTQRILDHWINTGYITGYNLLTKKGSELKGTASLYEIEISV